MGFSRGGTLFPPFSFPPPPPPSLHPFRPVSASPGSSVLPPHHDLHRHGAPHGDPRLVDFDQEGPAPLVAQHFDRFAGPYPHVLDTDGGPFPAARPCGIAMARPESVAAARDLVHDLALLAASQQPQRKHRSTPFRTWLETAHKRNGCPCRSRRRP